MAAKTTLRIGILALVAAGIFSFFYFDLQSLLSFEEIRARSDELQELQQANPLMSAITFFAIYVAITGLSLPGAAVLTLVAGAIFGFFLGLLLVSFASSLGATLAFLVSRTLLRDWVQTRFGHQLNSPHVGFAKDGSVYLFSFRQVAVFRFFVLHLFSVLLPIGLARVYWVLQVGVCDGRPV